MILYSRPLQILKRRVLTNLGHQNVPQIRAVFANIPQDTHY